MDKQDSIYMDGRVSNNICELLGGTDKQISFQVIGANFVFVTHIRGEDGYRLADLLTGS